MSQARNLQHMLEIAALTAMFGVVSSTLVYAQTGSSTSGSGTASSAKEASVVSSADQKLMRDMAYANLSEIEAGKLAQSKSTNEQVKNFSQRMIDDHTKAQQELQQLADAKGVQLPSEPDARHKDEMKKLQTMSGSQFDKKYMEQGGLSDHRSAHQLLARAQTSATDPDLKAMASKMLPTIDQHLHMAQQVSGAKSATSGSSDTTPK